MDDHGVRSLGRVVDVNAVEGLVGETCPLRADSESAGHALSQDGVGSGHEVHEPQWAGDADGSLVVGDGITGSKDDVPVTPPTRGDVRRISNEYRRVGGNVQEPEDI